MRRGERRNERELEETKRYHVRRQPLPLSRAILWKPLPDSYHLLASMMRAPEEQAQLFVTQRAFLQVERHLRSAPDLELGGFLAGHLCLCPRTGKRYSVVNTVLPFADVSEQPLGSRVTTEAHAKVRRRLDAHGLALVGWYRNGTGLGLQLLPDDIETHLEYFNEPWQTTMLVMPGPSTSKGAFFTYDPRVGRGYCIPFYELFNGLPESNRLDRTCVSWTTYVPSMPVQPLAAGDREVVETTIVPLRSDPEPEPPEPIDEWVEAIKEPWVRLKDVAVGATRRDEPSPSEDEPAVDAPYPLPTPLEPPERPPATVEAQRAPDESSPTSRPAAAAQRKEPARPEATRPTPTRPAPPFAGPVRPATGAPAPTPAPTFRSIPPAAAAAMAKAAEASGVALPPDFYDDAMRWQRRRRVGFAVAAAAFLTAILLSTVRTRTSGSAQAAPPAAPIATPTPVTQLTASDNGQVIPALPVAVRLLSEALSYYREIEAEHRGGRVGCRVLDRAYQQVGRARTHVDSARGRVAGALDAADSIRVSMLRAEYTHVAQTYRRSGCVG